jgi:hypothetical protein
MHRKAEEEADSSAIGNDDSASFPPAADWAKPPARGGLGQASRPRRIGPSFAPAADWAKLPARGAWTRQTPDELAVLTTKAVEPVRPSAPG